MCLYFVNETSGDKNIPNDQNIHQFIREISVVFIWLWQQSDNIWYIFRLVTRFKICSWLKLNIMTILGTIFYKHFYNRRSLTWACYFRAPQIYAILFLIV